MSDSSFGTKDIWVCNCSEIDCCEIVKYSCLSHRQPLCIACTFGLHSTCHLEEIGDIDVILKTAMMAEQLLIQSVKLKDSYRLNIKYPGIEDNINELLSEWNNFKSNYEDAANQTPADVMRLKGLQEQIINLKKLIDCSQSTKDCALFLLLLTNSRAVKGQSTNAFILNSESSQILHRPKEISVNLMANRLEINPIKSQIPKLENNKYDNKQIVQDSKSQYDTVYNFDNRNINSNSKF